MVIMFVNLMIHILAQIDEYDDHADLCKEWNALANVLDLHKPQEITLPNGEWGESCVECDGWNYPCKTVEIMGKELEW